MTRLTARLFALQRHSGFVNSVGAGASKAINYAGGAGNGRLSNRHILPKEQTASLSKGGNMNAQFKNRLQEMIVSCRKDADPRWRELHDYDRGYCEGLKDALDVFNAFESTERKPWSPLSVDAAELAAPDCKVSGPAAMRCNGCDGC